MSKDKAVDRDELEAYLGQGGADEVDVLIDDGYLGTDGNGGVYLLPTT